jgi:uncharacterized glyoxalase superfamily protein PhnB
MTTSATSPTAITGIAPMFLVDDVIRTAEWYRDALGFEIGPYYREDHAHDHDGNDIALPGGAEGDPYFVIIAREGHRLMLSKTVEPGRGVRSNVESKEFSGDAYLWCEGLDGLFSTAKAAAAEILLEPETQFYGMREFRVRDCDGRVITLGAPVA